MPSLNPVPETTVDLLTQHGFPFAVAHIWAVVLRGTAAQVLAHAQKWKKYGIADEDAPVWDRLGFIPETASIWYHCGFTARGAAFVYDRIEDGAVDGSIDGWLTSGLTPSEIVLAVGCRCSTVGQAQAMTRAIAAGELDRGQLQLNAAIRDHIDIPWLLR